MLEYLNLGDENMIAIQGAGGKTSTLFLLAEEFKASQKPCLISTTTKMGIVTKYDEFVSENEFRKLDENKVYFTSQKRLDDKEIGYPPSFFDEIFARKLISNIILETDGAKRMPIKGWRDDEPLNPRKITHCIGVLGLDSVNKPFDERFCHRKELMQNIIGNPKELTVDSYAKIINSSDGLFRHSYDARKFLILNKSDTKIDYENALKIVEKLDIDFDIFIMSHGKLIDRF